MLYEISVLGLRMLNCPRKLRFLCVCVRARARECACVQVGACRWVRACACVLYDNAKTKAAIQFLTLKLALL
jgi:hypothetical protein